MITRVGQRGPHDAVVGTPARAVGSVRRTTVIDSSRPDGVTGPVRMTATGRDLVTGTDGTAAAVAEASVTAVVDSGGGPVRELRTVPTVAGLDALVGAPVGAGFRGRLAAAAPGLESGSSLLHLLLDDLPGASLVGGYALLHADALPVTDGPAPPPKVDICAGWAEGSTMISTIRLTGRTPTPIGPPAPSLDRPGDPLAWTPLTDPGPHGTRRVRRIDLLAAGPDGLRPVDVFFRDTHWDGDGVETVVHEYSLAVVVDPLAGTVTGVRATPDVLPWMECPSAIASAGRIVGRALVDLRGLVRREFSGTSTCTHLNDTLRSLGDVEDLLRIAPV